MDISGIGEADAADRFPVLVKLSGGNFSYFMDVLPKGEDLRFIAADQQTPLKYHIEKYDPLTEIALIWVQVPKTGQAVTTGPVTTETIYMYYGNQEAVSAEDIAGVYDVNQAIVYHFDAVAGPRDATAYENHPAAFSGELRLFGSDTQTQVMPYTITQQYWCHLIGQFVTIRAHHYAQSAGFIIDRHCARPCNRQ